MLALAHFNLVCSNVYWMNWLSFFQQNSEIESKIIACFSRSYLS